MQIKNASNFQVINVNQAFSIYSAQAIKRPFVTAFEAALNPAVYRERFDAFAYVVVNCITHECLLVRDHIGVQPLFYAYEAASNTLVFGETVPDVIANLSQNPKLLDAVARLEFIEPRIYSNQTLYEGIYRVESGHMLHVSPKGIGQATPFWQLAPKGETLHYQDSREYVEQFADLLKKAVLDATQGVDAAHVSAEFSAGIDSTAVYLAARDAGIAPKLFMHSATPGTESEVLYDKTTEEAFLNHYQPDICRVGSMGLADFNWTTVFAEYANWFAGPAPFVFEVFAHHLHRAVANHGTKVLLSGFGGDQGVSGHMPIRFFIPELLRQKRLQTAWQALPRQRLQRKLLHVMQFSHPRIHALFQKASDIKITALNARKPIEERQLISVYPQQRDYFKSLREAEWHLLQGISSHEIRMRVESSSIVAKKMGFSYRYPLLHPELLTFYLSVPWSEKREGNRGRYLIRRYLARHMPASIFNRYQKKSGLNILPAAIDHYTAQFNAGRFASAFAALPYPELVEDKVARMRMNKSARSFMLQCWQASASSPVLEVL